ncbi:hypothetical protein SBRCBS47491_001279 [Sporothrix bragantina]|uniref:37S ribosomal protein n=1 Tax=Sporothrix bragantina TaxID=671064 RepID=A0ABP0AXC5_9PEZI
MDKASTSSLRLAHQLVQSIASPAVRPASRFFSSSSSSSTSTTSSSILTVLRRPCAATQPIRMFSSSAARKADQPPEGSGTEAPASASADTAASSKPPRPSSASLMEGLADLLPMSRDGSAAPAGSAQSPSSFSAAPRLSTGFDDLNLMKKDADQHMQGNYHFAVYAHKHNTHVTVSKPDGKVILSLSGGNLGFRKSNRGSYDAAYQLGAYAVDKLYQGNWHKKIQHMRVTLRGFGPGREALTKILLGTEGRPLRDKITQVSDTTRLKFGGSRSRAPRRLG